MSIIQEAQTTGIILMIRPANFGFNPETAGDNAFQINDSSMSRQAIREAAVVEFDAMVKALRSKGIEVIVEEDSTEPLKTDAVFPNNWMTTHESSCLFLYPMLAPMRRTERRMDIVRRLMSCYEVELHEEYLRYEENDEFLEGTGSMILDRTNRIVYACISERTHLSLLERWAKDNQYLAVPFHAFDDDDIPYYHTNVIMTVGTDLAVVCLESIKDKTEREQVEYHLNRTGKTVISITRQQVLQFAGNMLEVKGSSGPVIVLSRQAHESLTPSQKKTIQTGREILIVALDVIEKYGGGSARCMMAEIFFKKK